MKQHGFGLIEVLIATAILSVMSMALCSLMIFSAKEVSSIQKRITYGEMQSFISKVVTNTALCTASLAGKPAPIVGASVPSLGFAGLLIDDTTNSVYDSTIVVSAMKYSAVTLVGTSTQAIINLVANLQSPGSTDMIIGGNVPRPASFPVLLNISGGLIVNCL